MMPLTLRYACYADDGAPRAYEPPMRHISDIAATLPAPWRQRLLHYHSAMMMVDTLPPF